MKQITEITNDSSQKLNLIGEEGQEINFELFYKPTQQGWFYNLSYDNVTINGNRLITSPNILRPWKNILNFGIGINTSDNTEPFDIDDFINDRVQFYLLNSEDVETIEDELF